MFCDHTSIQAFDIAEGVNNSATRFIGPNPIKLCFVITPLFRQGFDINAEGVNNSATRFIKIWANLQSIMFCDHTSIQAGL